ASSIALITTSGSIPFSLASASMVCCNGLLIVSFVEAAFAPPWAGPYVPLSKLDLQVRARDDPERHAMRPSIVGFDQHIGAVEAAQLALEAPLAIDLLAHHDLGAAAGEAAVILG